MLKLIYYRDRKATNTFLLHLENSPWARINLSYSSKSPWLKIMPNFWKGGFVPRQKYPMHKCRNMRMLVKQYKGSNVITNQPKHAKSIACPQATLFQVYIIKISLFLETYWRSQAGHWWLYYITYRIIFILSYDVRNCCSLCNFYWMGGRDARLRNSQFLDEFLTYVKLIDCSICKFPLNPVTAIFSFSLFFFVKNLKSNFHWRYKC